MIESRGQLAHLIRSGISGNNRRLRGNALIEINRDARIDRPTLPYGWCGDRMDYGAAVDALFAGKYPDGFAARAAPE